MNRLFTGSRLEAEPYSIAESARAKGYVGITINLFSSPYYGQMLDGASRYLMARGYQVIAQSNLESHFGELTACESLAQLHCNGLIIHSDTLSDYELSELFATHANTVLLNRRLPGFLDRCVYVDNVRGGQLAARCLLSNGHECIASVTGPARFFESRDRCQGFDAELAKHGLEPSMCIEGNYEEDSGETAIRQILDSGNHITAVYFHNDEMAFGAMNFCRAHGINIPTDLSIIGYDGLDMCNYVSPRLTSVEQPLRQLGEHAASLLLSLMHSSTRELAGQSNDYQPVLAERESVAPPASYPEDKVALTQRETECLTWTARGKTAWEISVILGISESTATFHLRNAVTKLKASNRTHAVAKAVQSGMIDP